MKTVFSFVLDDQPKFLMQGWNLVLSLIESGTFPSPETELLLHYVRTVDPKQLHAFEALGVRLIPVLPFGFGPAVYCNKLRQLETPAVMEADYVVLLDADILAIADLHELCRGDAVRAKVVDFAVPPEAIWRPLLSEAGFPRDIPVTAPSFAPNERTPAVNCNGGLYVLPHKAVIALREVWPRWAEFCLERKISMGRWAHHADQIGFAMAMLETELPFAPLELKDNFPTCLEPAAYAHLPQTTLRTMHYHAQVDSEGLPIPPKGLPSDLDWLGSQILEARRRIAERRQTPLALVKSQAP